MSKVLPRRLALILPGAVALGAYEAGAVAALAYAVRHGQGALLVDTIVGASAGSITGLLFAHALVSGAEGGVEELWVKQASLDALLAGTTKTLPRAPLSTAKLEAWAATFLKTSGAAPLQREPILFVAGLANLRGLHYEIYTRTRGPRATVAATTSRDAKAFVLGAGQANDWPAAMEAAVTSGANALAFAPRKIRRSKNEYPPGVVFPESFEDFWYTDGGTVDNEPLGLALDAVYAPDRFGQALTLDLNLDRTAGERTFLVINPCPAEVPVPWPAAGAVAPSFGETALRSLALLATQSLYDDLQTVEKYNTRVIWRQKLEDALRRVLEELPSAAASDLRKAADESLREQSEICHALERALPEGHRDPLTTLLDLATGTAGKQAVRVEMVSPALGSKGKTIAQQLAGEDLGHFLGFTSEDARRWDYRLGYDNFAAWWASSELPSIYGFSIPPLEPMSLPDLGGFSWKHLPWPQRAWWVTRLVTRYGDEVARYAGQLLRGK